VDILLISTTPQHTASNPSVIQNCRRLKQWLTELPVNNIAQTVATLHDAIVAFNEQQINDDNRLKLLEVYWEAFNNILYFYDELRLHMLPIPTAKRKTLARDIMWLYLDLANGYKIIVNNAHANGDSPSNSKILLSTYRAMELIARAIVYAYHIHQAPPPLSYLEVHQLYLFAENHGVLDKRIRAMKNQTRYPTIDGIYKQFILLSMASIHVFQSNEIFAFYELLGDLAGECLISRDLGSTPSKHVFSLDLIDDKPPSSKPFNITAEQSGTYRLVSAHPLILRMENTLCQIMNNNESMRDTMEAKFYRLLIKLLDTEYRQQAALKAAMRNVKLAFGLDAINYYLLNKQQLQESYESEEIEVVKGIEVRSFDSQEQYKFELKSWSMADKDENTRILYATQHLNSKSIFKGQVVGIVQVDNETGEPSLSVGIINMINDESNKTCLHVEVVPGTPLPVTCVTTNQDKCNMHNYPAVYFPRDITARRPATLFTYKGEHMNSDFMRIEYGKKTYTIQTDNLVQETSTFVHFSLKPIRAA
jgi:hypothetical protein